MTHLLPPNPALIELQRQLRDGELTLLEYRAARSAYPEPGDQQCQRARCTRPALVVIDGVALCGVCCKIGGRRAI